jgi:hypothetical protein
VLCVDGGKDAEEGGVGREVLWREGEGGAGAYGELLGWRRGGEEGEDGCGCVDGVGVDILCAC